LDIAIRVASGYPPQTLSAPIHILWVIASGLPDFLTPYRVSPKPATLKSYSRGISVMKSRALLWRKWLDAGEVVNKAEIARREGVSRAYVTKVLKVF